MSTPTEVALELSNSFVQEFIPNPFLIGGRQVVFVPASLLVVWEIPFDKLKCNISLHRKFDIGLYVVIAGVAPLRVFTYEEEFLLR